MSGEVDALNFLMQMLKDEVKACLDLKSGARFELEQLQYEFGESVGRLKDAASICKKTATFREKEIRLRKVAYEVEDTIETYLTKKAARKRNIWGRIRGNSTRMAKKEVNSKLEASSEDSVELRYRDLEYHEQLCLLYTGLFPVDYDIPTSTLSQLWIAEKFIPSTSNEPMSLEESAEKIVVHLVDKGMLIAKKRILDRVKTCRVDATIRDFCVNKAKEELLFTVMESSLEGEPESVYRLCFHSDPSHFLSKQLIWPNARSFLCLVTEPLCLANTHTSAIPKAFKPLRILHLTSTKLEVLPKNITSLILLKHLTLSIDNLQSLPKGISKLSNLQTLIVKTGAALIKVPANIWEMAELRHMKTKSSFLLSDDSSSSAANHSLQTITTVSTKSPCLRTLYEKAPNLKSLGIQGKLYDFDLETISLQKFSHLHKLKLVNYVQFGLASEFRLDRLPRHDRFPPMLKTLTLLTTHLAWDTHMAILAKITTLEVLKVKENAFRGGIWNACAAVEFKKLNYLLIHDTDLHTWKAYPSQFPQLKYLVITDCKHFNHVPESLQKVEKLVIDVASRNH